MIFYSALTHLLAQYTFRYHSHAREQVAEGLYGTLIVDQPSEVENEMQVYDYDKEILLMVGDWFHRQNS